MPKGPAPKDRSLRLIDGNAGHRKVNTRQPSANRRRPTCPAWLTPAARKIFRATVLQLDRMGILHNADGQALAVYAASYARLVELQSDLAENGEIKVTDKGYEYQRPAVSIIARLTQQIRMYQSEFGLLPASRTRVKIETDEIDDFDAQLDGKLPT